MADKKGFANRLKQAMRSAGYVPRPVVLEREFNSRHRGDPVTPQAVRHWLSGRSVPTQEKLEVLADWLGVDVQVLRYGGKPLHEKRGTYLQWDKAIPTQDRETIERFLRLHSRRRKYLGELVADLSEVTTLPKPLGKASRKSSAKRAARLRTRSR